MTQAVGSSRQGSFSFHIQKFLNIKQEELVEDEVQEYKVTTSQEPRREEVVEEEEEEDDDDEEEVGTGGDYRSLLMNSYQLQQQREQRKEVRGDRNEKS